MRIEHLNFGTAGEFEEAMRQAWHELSWSVGAAAIS